MTVKLTDNREQKFAVVSERLHKAKIFQKCNQKRNEKGFKYNPKEIYKKESRDINCFTLPCLVW